MLLKPVPSITLNFDVVAFLCFYVLMTPSNEFVRVEVEIPANNTTVDSFTSGLWRLGGRIVLPSDVKEGLLPPDMAETYPQIGEDALRAFAAHELGLTKGTTTKLMTSLLLMTEESLSDKTQVVDMTLVRNTVRQFEAGKSHNFGLGARTWDAMTTINNRFVKAAEDVIFPWDTQIHYRIHSWSHNSPHRRIAIAELESRYERYRNLAASTGRLPLSIRVGRNVVEVPF